MPSASAGLPSSTGTTGQGRKGKTASFTLESVSFWLQKVADLLPIVLQREDHGPELLEKIVRAAEGDLQLVRLEVYPLWQAAEPGAHQRGGGGVAGDLLVLAGRKLEHAVQVGLDALPAGDLRGEAAVLTGSLQLLDEN